MLFGATACAQSLSDRTVQSTLPTWHTDTQPIMGTRVHVEILHKDQEYAAATIAAVMAEMHRIDHAFSPYKETSEISRVNRNAGAGWVEISNEMAELLRKSAQISQLTGGAFDITYASIGRYYDYREEKTPDEASIQAAIHAIDYRHVELEQNRVRFKHPSVYIDLGGIAKGYAVDRGIQILSERGIAQGSVAAGGDSRILGDRGGQPWTVGVQHPREPDKMAVLLPLIDTAVSTSGDYERYFERDGVRYHHILDPSTGRSADGAWSVTILGDEAMFTDGLSTSVFVLGPEKGMALINRMPGVDAIIIDPAGQMTYSDDLSGL
ncbi:MAG: FAD:protein FMN transferase [Pseudomonadales bacterium]|nr:FAD:protein FMN transferase [Pseudomonadales bacterium]